MRIARRRKLSLPILFFLLIAGPQFAGIAGERIKQADGWGHGDGDRTGQHDGGGRGGGDAKGTPAPVAGLGVVALGALVYGRRRLRIHRK